MKKTTGITPTILLSVGMITLSAAPACSQTPAKFFFNLRNFFRPRATVTAKASPGTILKGAAAATSQIPQQTTHGLTASLSYASLRPLTDSNTANAQNILTSTLRKPAPDLYGLFKQVVYAHQKNSAVTKKMTQDYYHEVYFLLQNAAYIEKTLGYNTLASYLRQHNGQMPTLSAAGKYQTSETIRQRLTFYAGEELNNLLGKMLSRAPSKRTPTTNEWLTINILSIMLPAKTRLVFYDLLLEKHYADLQAIALDPYLKNANTLRRIKNGEAPVIPTQAQRITRYQKLLKKLLQEQKQLTANIAYQRQQCAKQQVIYDMLRANGQTQDAATAKNALAKTQRKLQRNEKRMREVTDLTQRFTFELHFLQGK